MHALHILTKAKLEYHYLVSLHLSSLKLCVTNESQAITLFLESRKNVLLDTVLVYFLKLKKDVTRFGIMYGGTR